MLLTNYLGIDNDNNMYEYVMITFNIIMHNKYNNK